jgi:hypothetical protein
MGVSKATAGDNAVILRHRESPILKQDHLDKAILLLFDPIK